MDTNSKSATHMLRQIVLDEKAARQPRKVMQRRKQNKALTPLEKTKRLPLTLEGIHKRMHDPISLQWLVDDFIESAGEGLESRVDLFVRAGIPIDRTHTVLGYTAMHAAANQPDGRIMARLIRAGADVNALATTQSTPLHTAVMFGNQACVEQLLRHDAAKIPGQDRMLPYDVAQEFPSEAIQTMLQGVPYPPARLACVLSEPSNLHLSWEPGVASTRRSATAPAPILQYRVQWKLETAVEPSTIVCSKANLVVRNLVPATLYVITVQAGNAAGWSRDSSNLFATTAPSVPTAPKAPRVTSVADKFIKMLLPVPEPNGLEIQRLVVLVQRTGSINLSTTDAFMSLMDVKAVDGAWTQLWVGDPAKLALKRDGFREFVASGLTPGCVYFFRLKAANALGWSDAGDVSDGICTNDAPKMVERSSTSLTLIWPKPYSPYDIDMYELSYRFVGAQDWLLVPSTVHDQRYCVQGLVPATAFQFQVRPHYAFVPLGEPSWETLTNCAISPVFYTEGAAPEGPVDVRMLARSQTTMDVAWSAPRCNGFVVLTYELQRQAMRERVASNLLSGAETDPTAPWITVSNSIPVEFSSVHVPGLAVGTPYSFRIRARNALGWGEYGAPSLAFWTHAFLPPTPPVAVAKTSYSLTLTWMDQADVNSRHDMKEHFEVHMCPLPTYSPLDQLGTSAATKGTWTIVDDRLPSRTCVVPNLSALSWYCFRVRAWVRHRGWTEFSLESPPIQTLRRM
ncbi:hypothetical protein SDRG_16666 [Saprolegnia diclina VS20]|uniref:Fibronectin type-III domain-containing protein n=1 Tax=Saprolegnia diclina (strain VS20) TaxID=1156394 RepID=T0PT95_SAPDV|nr:hypothetical protein SDRG_16666 [Saprolegnia diclina VS20]EQC25446.1 hypothetical protein SDRG_16666 [Saprolegnia diclina VS20]|eukprot:XP_008621105.1 hypothetical protein SDRG_16666 [Saprolegnia diclina VS20]